MGATNFSAVAVGKTAGEAFAEAVREARYLHGHEGYTGSVAEKHGFQLFTLGVAPRDPSDVPVFVEALESAQAFANQGDPKTAAKYLARVPKKFREDPTFRAMARLYGNKYSNAVAIEVTGKAAKEIKARFGGARGKKAFLFFGLASC